MDKQVVTTSENPKVNLEVDGDLILKGWDELEISVKCSSGEDLALEQHDDEVTIKCRSQCAVRVPFGAAIQVNRVSGHANIKSLDGQLVIQEIAGDLTLRSVGSTRIERVNGHLIAKNVNGDLRIGTVDGDAVARDVQGDFTVEKAVHGHLVLKDVDGSATATAQGDITLSFDPSPGNTYRFEAQGQLLCRIPSDASVEVKIERASKIRIKIPDVQEVSLSQGPYSFTLGEGDAALTLSAHGDILLSSLPRDWDVEDIEVELGEDFEGMAETISAQVSHQIDAQMEMLEHQLESQLDNLSNVLKSAGLSAEQAGRMAERAREASERAQARAQEKLQRAQEKLQRKLETARRRAEMRVRASERAARDRRRRPEPSGWSPTAAENSPQPPTDEERLLILQMLEQKKITAEEAEQLLAALDG
jgi:hypothetical protein